MSSFFLSKADTLEGGFSKADTRKKLTSWGECGIKKVGFSGFVVGEMVGDFLGQRVYPQNRTPQRSVKGVSRQFSGSKINFVVAPRTSTHVGFSRRDFGGILGHFAFSGQKLGNEPATAGTRAERAGGPWAWLGVVGLDKVFILCCNALGWRFLIFFL